MTRIVDIHMRLSDPELADAVIKASEGAKDVTDQQIRQFTFYCGARFHNAEDAFNQFREGLLDQVAFDSMVGGLRASLAEPGMRAFYRRQRARFGRGFDEFVDKLLAETRLSRSSIRWRSGVPTSPRNWRRGRLPHDTSGCGA